MKPNPTHICKLHIYIQLTGNFTSSVLSGKRVNVHSLSNALRVSKFACYSSKCMWEVSRCSPTLPQKPLEEPNIKTNMIGNRVFSTKVETFIFLKTILHSSSVFSRGDTHRLFPSDTICRYL